MVSMLFLLAFLVAPPMLVLAAPFGAASTYGLYPKSVPFNLHGSLGFRKLVLPRLWVPPLTGLLVTLERRSYQAILQVLQLTEALTLLVLQFMEARTLLELQFTAARTRLALLFMARLSQGIPAGRPQFTEYPATPEEPRLRNKLVVVHFWAEWAPQCAQMDEVLKELAGDMQFVNVVFLRGDKAVDRVDGAKAAELTQKVGKYVSADLNTRLKRLINSAPVMLFMKGDPEQPRCGFSKQTVQLLNERNVKYKTFDILTDDEVRQGLKTYSNWPTYPQLYVNGELIGGLDILKEMVESGELQSVLPAEEDLDTSAKYDTFDILSDEEVRQGLKKFSNWPTYPQLYVKGELLGGLDIIKEMKENGELQEALTTS
nr:hypothetical protein BaRGS_032220 [Batillaria attramentaria]